MIEHPIPPDLLRALLRYEPRSGRLYWRPRPLVLCKNGRAQAVFNALYAGTEAFTALDAGGYRSGRIFGKTYLGHRVAWAIMTGEWPSEQIDHENGVRRDNRWSNLREVDQTGNNCNAALHRNNTSGRVGVCWDRARGQWTAQLRIRGQQLNLGRFESFEQACSAREKAEREYGFHANHGRPQVAA